MACSPDFSSLDFATHQIVKSNFKESAVGNLSRWEGIEENPATSTVEHLRTKRNAVKLWGIPYITETGMLFFFFWGGGGGEGGIGPLQACRMVQASNTLTIAKGVGEGSNCPPVFAGYYPLIDITEGEERSDQSESRQ